MEVLVLTRPEFTGLLDEVPGLSRKLLTAMARRLRESDAKAYD
jgi:CRP-like cAMP-binding protein